jgi:PPM family protein phosphatase
MKAAGGQIQGARARQEDAWGIELFGAGEALALVADGLGGHPAGDVASREGIAQVRKHFARYRTRGTEGPRDWLKQAVMDADRYLLRMQLDNVDLEGMATTLVAFYLHGAEFWAASVGDSYLLLRRQERLICLNELHAEGGGVTSCVGFNLSRMDLADRLLVEPGDRFLLASDGIATLESEEVNGLLAAAEDPETAVRDLLAAIEASGAPRQDNATLLAVFA